MSQFALVNKKTKVGFLKEMRKVSPAYYQQVFNRNSRWLIVFRDDE